MDSKGLNFSGTDIIWEERIEILRKYKLLLSGIKPFPTKEKLRTIRKALNLALDAHKDMRRLSGEPFIYHPLEVAVIVSKEMGLGVTSVICALLHDVVEDTDYTLSDIEGLFGEKSAKIIDGLTKIEEIVDHSSKSLQAENYKRILLTLSDDIRVILIKLADRLHNMRTLDSMSPEKQLKKSSETLQFYSPLALRLGLYSIKSELEDLSLKYTEPEVYHTILKKIDETSKERDLFIESFIHPIRKALNENNIQSEISTRLKSIFSIWQKMKKKEIPFEEVYDLFAIRIVIETNLANEKVDCWRVYSIITDFYRPNMERLRDWISTPKPNGYEALHTTLMSHTGKWVEVQIRSQRMQEIAERGYAAHWKYKDDHKNDHVFEEWLRKIREHIKSNDDDALNFIDDFRINFFADEMFIFTPKGDIKKLPVGASALDFAYSIHSQIGNQCIGAKVNHKLVALQHKLRSGDQVEIITSRKQEPKEEWLQMVITSRAKSQIKDALKETRKSYSEKGKEKLIQYFEQLGLEFSDDNLNKFSDFINADNLTDLFYKVYNGEVGIPDLKNCCLKHESGNWLRLIRKPFTKRVPSSTKDLEGELIEKIKNKPELLLLGEDIRQINYRVSDCCNPIPGDDVIGLLESDQAISIHRVKCPVAISFMSKYGNKIIKAKWKEKESIGFLTGIKIISFDKKGLINQLTKVITEENDLNIRSFHLETHGEISEGIVMLYVTNTNLLNKVISEIRKIDGITKVYRINSYDNTSEQIS